jgi:hypothetical protein
MLLLGLLCPAVCPQALASGGGGAEEAPKEGEPAAGTFGPQDMNKPAAAGAPEEDAAQPPLSPQEAAKLERLRERAQQRWNALVARDFAKVYTFETPAFREAHTAAEHAREFGGRVRWHLAHIKDLGYHPPDEAEVVVSLEYSFPLPTDDWARTTAEVREKWIFLDNEWWRKETPRPLAGGKPSQPPRQE